MKLLVRTHPQIGESLSSYLQRISEQNYISPHDLWRLFKKNGTHYPQASFSDILEISPGSVIELEDLASALNMQKYQLEDLTFAPIFQKFNIAIDSIHKSRILSNMIEKHRKYCPKCLEENPYYKLIWQISEVKFCLRHNIELLSDCKQCKKRISILPSSCEIGVCPECHWNLKSSISQFYQAHSSDIRNVEDWTYLLDPTTDKLKLVYDFTSEQSLALRLLYISNSFYNDIEKSRNEHITLSSIMQIARNTKVTQTHIHMNTILHFVRKHNISLQEFFTIKVPENYINSIFKQKNRMVYNYSCIAPWCKYYNIPGSLERTSTSVKNLKSGKELKYYMFCSGCGTEYGIDKKDNSLVERGYFINLAWYKVKGELNGSCIFTVLSRKMCITEDKLRRAIIFLAANNIVNHNQVPIDIPTSHSPEILSLVEKYIKQGLSARYIQKILNLKYNDFLYYWLSARIRKIYITNVVSKCKKANFEIEKTQKFENAINSLLSKGSPITINSVCAILNICPETLRNWGLLNELKKYKLMQKNQLNEEFKTNLIRNVDYIISNSISKGAYVPSDTLYKSLGIRRTVLVRKFPAITQYIHSRLIELNKLKS